MRRKQVYDYNKIKRNNNKNSWETVVLGLGGLEKQETIWEYISWLCCWATFLLLMPKAPTERKISKKYL